MAMLAADCADVVARPIAGPFPPRQVRKTAEQNEQNSLLMRNLRHAKFLNSKKNSV
ncbi:MAG TPA: hypothetical protein VEH02_05420 [Pseudolabrys sp.]|nr:hypothetical protein [Pseudolabrys sp.]